VVSFTQLVLANPKSRPARSLRSTRLLDLALVNRRKELNAVKRWAEADLGGLPMEEPDVFDRKAGQLFETGRDNFL
jgi:hypothetical protein